MVKKANVFFALRVVIFSIVASVIILYVNNLFHPKAYYIHDWPTTNTFEDFYALEKDSVDVLMFGSSHVVSALNPLTMYYYNGIASYNMGSEQQSTLVTYYWLKEALKYQSPKVVILDTYTFYKYNDFYIYNDMNCTEPAVRTAMDSMRISPLKWQAAQDIVRYDPTQDALSYLLLNIRYHTRWTELKENDYIEDEMAKHGGMKGYTLITGNNPEYGSYVPFSAAYAETVEPDEMVPIAQEYLDKIVDLCNEEGIQLIFVTTPYAENPARYKSNKAYADAKGIPYYDFDEEVIYNSIGYNAAEDLMDHLNYKGAEKVSIYLANLLANEYGITSRDDESYVKAAQLYECKLAAAELSQITDPVEYVQKLDDEEYSIFIFAPTNYSEFMPDSIMNSLHELGFNFDLKSMNSGDHYFAVKDAGKVTERVDKEDVSYAGSISNGKVLYNVVIDTRNMREQRHVYSLTIGKTNYGNGNDGINIVVYDNNIQRVVDKVNINTNTPEILLSR